MFKERITDENGTRTIIDWKQIIVAIAIITFTTVTFIVIHTTAVNKKRAQGTIVTITSCAEIEPHKEVINTWDYDNDYNNEHYTVVEYYEYSGPCIVEVSTYDGEKLGKFEINPKYYEKDKIYKGAEIDTYKLQEITKNHEIITKETSNKEVTQETNVEKQKITETIVSAKKQ